MSDRSLYILQNLSSLDITLLSRYAVSFEPGELYQPVLPGSSESSTVDTAIDIIRRDLTGMGCDIVASIDALTQVVASNACGCPVGQGEDTADGVQGGPVPPPIGNIVYQEPSAADDRSCKAANLIHQTLREIFIDLSAYNVDDMSVLGLSLVVGIVAGVIASTVVTPLGGVMVAVAGSLAVFVARMIGVTVSLADIVNAMSVRQTDLVCALFSSNSASTAKAAYLSVLSEQIPIGPAEEALVGLMMTNALMVTLFFDTPELVSFWPTYVGPVDCTGCAGTPVFSLIEDVPGVPPATIVGSNRFLVGDKVTVITGADALCAGRWKIPAEFLQGGVQFAATIDVDMVSGWTDTCAFPCADNESVVWGPGFSPVIQFWTCDLLPEGFGLVGAGIVKVQSASSATWEFTRTA